VQPSPAQVAHDESALIAACVRGDRTAERTLFRREYPRVNATVYRLLGSSRDTDDLVQETFIAVFRALPKFRGESKLSTWIDRIAVRVVFAHVAQRKRVPVPLEVVPDVVDGTGALDDRAHARDGLRRLYRVLDRLSPEARTAFVVFAIDGRSIAEVAELTETSAIAAKLRIWRARREVAKRAAGDAVLRELLGPEAP
jgi:RNA polymerase sigma-70 factor (ECF subfamily)